MIGTAKPKPRKGQVWLDGRTRRSERRAHEQREMQAALRRDARTCRVPRCDYGDMKVDPGEWAARTHRQRETDRHLLHINLQIAVVVVVVMSAAERDHGRPLSSGRLWDCRPCPDAPGALSVAVGL